jgi:hypothetical protein
MNANRKVYAKDEKCLNCQYPLIGDFCSQCGQKANLHKDSFWHMMIHFFGDYFHYDNKFWKTMRALFLSPGKLSLDYIQGKRATYLNPIPLYILVTTLFFIVNGWEVTSNKESKEEVEFSKNEIKVETQDSLLQLANDGKNLKVSMDTNGIHVNGYQSVEQYDSLQNALPDSLKSTGLNRYFERKSIKLKKDTGNDLSLTEMFEEKISHSVPKLLFLLMPF